MDPPRADIRLGYKCNHNCKFCCVSDHRSFNEPTDKVKQDIDEGVKNGAQKLVFTGGEPTIREDIIELLKYAKLKGFRDILIITNGHKTSSPYFFNQLVNAGMTSICFSLPCIRKNRYEYLTQVQGSYDKLIKSLRNAAEHELAVSTITVITKVNYQFLPNITHFLSKLKNQYKDFFSEFMFINPTDNAWRYRKSMVPQICNVAPFVRESLNIAKTKNLTLNIEAIPFCYMKDYENNLVELHMARERVFMDPEKSPDYNYNQNRRVKAKTKNQNCKTCPRKQICEGVWNSYASIYGTNELIYSASKPTRCKLLNATIACNQQCIFCTHDKFLSKEIPDFKKKPVIKEKGELFGNNINQIKKEIFDSKCEELTISGGEPTTRNDLDEIIRYAKACKCKEIVLNTNGVNLSDFNYLTGLKKAGLTRNLISLHSHIKKESALICQKEGNFEKTLQGIKNSLRLNLKTNIVHVIFENNYRYLPEFVDFVSKELNEIKCINFVFIKPNSENVEEIKHLSPRLSDIEPFLRKAMDKCKHYNIQFNIANVPVCFMKEYEKYNSQKEEMEMAGINFDEWLKKRYENNEMDQYGYKHKDCINCNYYHKCPGLLKEYYLLHSNEELNPIK